MKQGRKIKLKLSRKMLFTGVGVLTLLAVLGGYWYVSAMAWQEFDRGTVALEQTISHQKKVILAQNSSISERKRAISGLGRIDLDSNRCKGAWWYNWQAKLNTSRIERCESTVKTAQSLQQQAQQTHSLLENEERLATIVGSLAAKKETLDEDSWSKAHKAVKDARNSLKDLEVSATKGYKPVIEVAKKRFATLDETWQALISAHKKKDEPAFVASVGELDQAYSGLKDIADRSDSVLQVSLTLLPDTL